MKKIFTILFIFGVFIVSNAQWNPTNFKGKKIREEVNPRHYYSLDIDMLRGQLANAQEMGVNSRPIIVSLPTLDGKVESFAVYSFPVVVKELADQYQLGSYVGTAVNDPTKYVRFSLAPNDFQSMMIHNGRSEFIELMNTDKTVYGVFPKTKKSKEGYRFTCSTEEGTAAQSEINELFKNSNHFSNNSSNFAKSSDKKYRTMRIAISTTGEYTTFFGGTAGALAQVNATLTRVNGVYEKDLGLHLILQNYPSLIYANAATDPYATVTSPDSPPASWNSSLQSTLTTVVGNANYDIGHLFGASGGGGNAGCIGCVCVNPVGTNLGKGAGITSPMTGSVNASPTAPPSGDSFDIDFVAHELGHQLGATHSFSHEIQGTTPTHMEPGSGSTIMGYAGITGGPTTDVQNNSDPYFHVASIVQIESNLNNRTCDVETAVTNNPPSISALPTYNIPKGTAFVLTANVTDTENDPMTYTWEQFDGATVAIDATNIGTTTTGPSFRSVLPSNSPTRYFPKLSSVMNGILDNSGNTWESVSMVPRTTKFVITARDNSPQINQQQTASALQEIIVGNEGPFKVTTTHVFHTIASNIQWDVVNTNAAPYNVVNVKIDYTTDDGATWTVLSASTPNDGSESFILPSSLDNQAIKVRVSSIGNVFYAIGKVLVVTQVNCDGSAPNGVQVVNVTNTTANVNWAPISGASYAIQYRPVGSSTWTLASSTTNSIGLSGLLANTAYEVQVAAICSGTQGSNSSIVPFSTLSTIYCSAETSSTQYEYISNVTIANVNNNSSFSTYTNYTTNPSLQVNLVEGNTYNISVTKAWSAGGADYDAVSAWIDFNLNGQFEDSERVLTSPVSITTPVSGSFTVPATAVVGQPLRLRVINIYGGESAVGQILVGSCGIFGYGEVEDYNVVITSTLSTSELNIASDIKIFPNPVTDILNVSNVSDKAIYIIYSASGQLVSKGKVTNGKINVTQLVKGGYTITIDDKEISTSHKFIKN